MSGWNIAANSELLPSGHTSESGGRLSVSGNGEVSVVPDILRLRLEVAARESDPAKARELASGTLSEATLLLRQSEKFTVIEADTVVYPVYTDSAPGRARTISYYEAKAYLKVETENTEKKLEETDVLLVHDKLTQISATYDLGNREMYKKQAVQLATFNAYSTARAMSDAAGVKLSGILSMSTQHGLIRPYSRERGAESSDQPGEVPVSLEEIVLRVKTIPVRARVDTVFATTGTIYGEARGTTETPALNTGLVRDMNRLTVENTFYRRVLQTTNEQQLVVMSLKEGDAVPSEIHANLTQFLRVEQGAVEAQIGRQSGLVSDDQFVIIPAGVKHSFRQVGPLPAKLHVIYSSSNGKFEHKDQEIEATQPKEGPKSKIDGATAAALPFRCDLVQ